MSRSGNDDGMHDAEVTTLEAHWRTAAQAPSPAFLAQCVARTRAELNVQKQKSATVRFYVAAAAVLLIGWHTSLIATLSTASRQASGASAAIAAREPDATSRRALLAELAAELDRTARR